MDPNPPLVALSDHPRAARSIRQIKAWGGLLGFVVVAGFSYLGGMGVADALLRGVIAGVAGQMLAWIAAIVLWQQLLEGEAKKAVRQAKEKQMRALQRSSHTGTEA
jgi:uncharacterized membrane protein YccC